MIPVRPGVLFDPTGKVGNPAARIVCEDTFERDASGWKALVSTGESRNGCVYRRIRNGQWSLCARTPNLGGVSTMAIKRMGQHYGPGRHLVEMLTFAEDSNLDRTRPHYREFGLDTARESDGARWFNVIRWRIYDEVGAAQLNRFEYQTTAGAWVPVPGGTFTVNGGFWPTNENKGLPFYLAMEFDTYSGAYLGFRFGNLIKVGSLADVPSDTAFGGAVAGGAPTDLDIFAGGLNPFFGIVNRSTGVNVTASCQGINWHRTTFISPTGGA